jgi:hypothetical protein
VIYCPGGATGFSPALGFNPGNRPPGRRALKRAPGQIYKKQTRSSFLEGRQSLNSALVRIILANGRLYLLPNKYPIPFR